MMNSKEILQKLSLDDYEKILYGLGVKDIQKLQNYWITQTICHNLYASNASNKLYFYLDTKSFFP